MIIDTHVHLWLLDRAECLWPTAAEGAIHRDYDIDQLKRVLRPAEVDRAILVQSQEHDDDTNWLLEIACDEPLVAGVVGWCELEAESAAARVAEMAAHPKSVGMRPMVQHRHADYYDEPSLDAGLTALADSGLVLDALVRPVHLPALERLALRYPQMPIVIDHAAKPEIDRDDGFRIWRDSMAGLADRPNVTCKLSGLLTECGDRSPEAVKPYVSELLSLFGAERLLWGSDWPVLNLVGDYESWLALARSLVPARDHESVFGRSAVRTYRLQAAPAR